jgi:hypothetical protein
VKEELSPGLIIVVALVGIGGLILAESYPQVFYWFYDGDDVSLRFLLIIPLMFPFVLAALAIDALWDGIKKG